MIAGQRHPAVRIVHVPTGEVVLAEHRVQYRARNMAFALLRSRLWALANGAWRSPAIVHTVRLPHADPYPADLLAYRPPITALPEPPT